MILRGGENIYCAEVEGALYTHPAVLETVAFAVPDDRLGEEVGVDGKGADRDALDAHGSSRRAASLTGGGRGEVGNGGFTDGPRGPPCPHHEGTETRRATEEGVDGAEGVVLAGVVRGLAERFRPGFRPDTPAGGRPERI